MTYQLQLVRFYSSDSHLPDSMASFCNGKLLHHLTPVVAGEAARDKFAIQSWEACRDHLAATQSGFEQEDIILVHISVVVPSNLKSKANLAAQIVGESPFALNGFASKPHKSSKPKSNAPISIEVQQEFFFGGMTCPSY